MIFGMVYMGSPPDKGRRAHYARGPWTVKHDPGHKTAGASIADRIANARGSMATAPFRPRAGAGDLFAPDERRGRRYRRAKECPLARWLRAARETPPPLRGFRYQRPS